MAREFESLRVAAVDTLTDDAVAITLSVPDHLRARFAFAAGQSLTVRVGDERRSYSICAPVGRPPRIGVREVAGGAVSTQLVRGLRPGDTLEVQPPSGSFTPDLGTPGHHVLLAAGSGITPMLSIAASVLAADERSTVTLLYGNRRAGTVMFADEVADLKDADPTRMRVVHVLSREPQEVELFTGRLDGPRLRRLLPEVVDVPGGVPGVDHWWLCGPYGLVVEATDVLTDLGVERDRIHRELFWVGDDPPVTAHHEDAPVGPGAEVTVVLDGRRTPVTVTPGTTVLDAAQQVRPDLPFACKGGVCGTCRALVTEGAMTMRRNYALEPAEVAAGYVLTCQAMPTTATATVDFDS